MQRRAGLREACQRSKDARLTLDEPDKQRAPREVQRDLVGAILELARKRFDRGDDKERVRELLSLRRVRPVAKPIHAWIDRNREYRRIVPCRSKRGMTVTRADVDDDAGEGGGQSIDLTDVNLAETAPNKNAHDANLS
ncbi:MAG: hypothetical protein AUH85_04035 [Chloroflexi bacterium 13_1_40CM_4_68_4]|nr:MAG: hypothetical protein AUH85_04035 [Chloroflexi bacterium 13_1_40CM_4_68_4]